VTAYSVGHYLFDHHVNGLIEAVQKAAQPAKYPPDHPLHDYEPYYGEIVGGAVWRAKHVVREAKRLGLVESDPMDVRVRLVEMDVLAGEAS
jgi:hypothetical protein